MTTKTRQRRLTNDPTTWAADLTRPAVDAASLGASDLTHIATIAGGSCRPAETAGGDTVATPASSGQHAGDGPSASLSASADTVAIRLPIPNVSTPLVSIAARHSSPVGRGRASVVPTAGAWRGLTATPNGRPNWPSAIRRG
jgi:hypothetical protein